MYGIGTLNLKVIVLDSDYYSLQAINSYLAWDRRTRVVFLADHAQKMWRYLSELPPSELPDVVVVDADHQGGVQGLQRVIEDLRQRIPQVMVICLAQGEADPELVLAAVHAGARAYMLKQEVRLQIAWAVCSALEEDLLLSESVWDATRHLADERLQFAAILPDERNYPEMTDRIRQAIKLCVIEGMPAHLAADEMGISLHTIRGYIKEGYRILESHDETEYPSDMTPQERAFMRFTALAEEVDAAPAELETDQDEESPLH